MKLILLRHGQTFGNEGNVYEGHLPGKLSPIGVEQAKKVASRLKDEKIDAIFCSDIGRAMETAKEIVAYHKHTPFFISKEIRELNFGSWQGKTKKELGFREGYRPPLPADAETRDQLFNRVKSFLELIKESYSDKTILLVSHNATNKALISVLTNRKPEEMENMETLHNTSLTIFELSKNKCQTILYNCRKHLE
ncbi:histidine phosphatase family protein [Candidatus Pacearchaeota archaeon]|nr:histidine phosphatase family protein [Candidatus Pacearchaeota archaeon]